MITPRRESQEPSDNVRTPSLRQSLFKANVRAETAKTLQIQKTILNESRKLKVRISGAKYEITGILAKTKSNLSFKIESPTYEWEVRRLDEHFYILRKCFLRSYPFLVCPPLPDYTEKKFSKKSLLRRIKLLQRFLDGCLKIPEYKSTQVMVTFLSNTGNLLKEFKKEEDFFN